MTPPQQEAYYRTKRHLLYFKIMIVASLVAILLIWYDGCQSEKNASVAYQSIKDTLQSVLNDTAVIRARVRELKQERDELALSVAAIISDRDMIQGALIDESDRSLELAAALKIAKRMRDTAKYIAKCDSLAEQVGILRVKTDSLIIVIKKSDSAHDDLLLNMQAQKDNFERAYDSCLRAVSFASKELPKLEPKGQWFITLGGIGGRVVGAKTGLTHISKKNRLLNVDVAGTNYGVLVEVKAGIPLIFKRIFH